MSIELTKWGPPKLREIIGEIEKAINESTPLPGLGIEVDVNPGGTQIHTKDAEQNQKSPAQQQASGGGSGTSVDLYGALNGAPADYHLVQTAPPTPRS